MRTLQLGGGREKDRGGGKRANKKPGPKTKTKNARDKKELKKRAADTLSSDIT
jgi:hypothetical protein